MQTVHTSETDGALHTADGLPDGRQHSIRHRVITACFLALLTIVFAVKHLGEPPDFPWDFQEFYIAGQMVRHGQSARLYDLATQAAFQTQYVDRSRPVIDPDAPFLGPPATALLFLPMAWLPIMAAYAGWTGVNLLLLVATIRLLQRHLSIPQGDRPLFFALVFAPAYVSLLAGQFSFVMLFLYTLTFVLVRQRKEFIAGTVLGLGMLKFPLVLGFMAIMFLRRRWRFAGGAGIGGLLVVAISALTSGWSALLSYPSFLRTVAYHPHVAYTAGMVNIRGLLWLLTGREVSAWIIAPVSGLLLVWAALSWKDVDSGFSIALIATILTTYHAYAYDLTLLLLPIAVVASQLKWDSRALVAGGLTLLIIYALASFGLPALVGVLLMSLLLLDLWKTRRKLALADASIQPV